ncbi:nitroreductase/quinone reductase family protein [Streptomyces roseolus]|uniref:nitroreductase/quinone reductase family protein n=1 Tax=Streptomyces roseolus TaxID=67358 RepID=UPI001E3EFEFC|nr:nitroreductase/quinone reductase family protein [Streptomyces roseolus]
MGGHDLSGGAADRGGVHPGGAQAEVFGDLHGGERAESGGGEAVDEGAVESAVGEGAPGGLGVERVGGGPVDPAAVGERDAGDGDPAPAGTGETIPVRAERLTGEDRAAAWKAALALWPPYASYQARVEREIRLFRLTRG